MLELYCLAVRIKRYRIKYIIIVVWKSFKISKIMSLVRYRLVDHNRRNIIASDQKHKTNTSYSYCDVIRILNRYHKKYLECRRKNVRGPRIACGRSVVLTLVYDQ